MAGRSANATECRDWLDHVHRVPIVALPKWKDGNNPPKMQYRCEKLNAKTQDSKGAKRKRWGLNRRVAKDMEKNRFDMNVILAQKFLFDGSNMQTFQV